MLEANIILSIAEVKYNKNGTKPKPHHTMSTLKTNLKSLRKKLPKGTVGAIARRRKISAEYVRRVLRGEAIRLDVIQDAIEAVEKEQLKLSRIKKAITQL